MVNGVNYHPCPSRLAPKRNSFIFFKTPKGFISLQNACWIFSNLYIPPCVSPTAERARENYDLPYKNLIRKYEDDLEH